MHITSGITQDSLKLQPDNPKSIMTISQQNKHKCQQILSINLLFQPKGALQTGLTAIEIISRFTVRPRQHSRTPQIQQRHSSNS
jgi:hypothetical protein